MKLTLKRISLSSIFLLIGVSAVFLWSMGVKPHMENFITKVVMGLVVSE